MAAKYFGAANPLGKRYRMRKREKLSDPFEIAGIVRDSKSGSLREEIAPTVYVALSQDAAPDPQRTFELRTTAGAPTIPIAAVKSAMAAMDPGASLEFATLSTKIDKSLARERLLVAPSGFFGALALLLATMGLYGVMSHNIARRS
jgi:putative ABC transport system permease protein